jgi:hypothetical protein
VSELRENVTAPGLVRVHLKSRRGSQMSDLPRSPKHVDILPMHDAQYMWNGNREKQWEKANPTFCKERST